MDIFVIMQFDDELNDVYQDLIKAPLEKREHRVNRADDISKDQSILRTIVRGIRDADLIIADLTGQNPNVYYELGIAHDMRKPTLHIVQEYGDLAFDVRPYNAIKYSTKYNEAHKLADAILSTIERESANKYRFSNPVNETLDGGSAIYVGGNTTSAVHDDSASVTEEIRSTSSTVNIMFEMIAALTERYMSALEANQTHRDRTKRLGESEQLSAQLLLTRQYAKHVVDFASTVGDTLPMFKESWIALDQDLSQIFISSSIRTAAESREVSTFVETIQLLVRKVTDVASKLDSLYDSLSQDTGLSADVDRDLRLSASTVRKVTDELRAGSAVLTNIAERITAALHQAAY